MRVTLIGPGAAAAGEAVIEFLSDQFGQVPTQETRSISRAGEPAGLVNRLFQPVRGG